MAASAAVAPTKPSMAQRECKSSHSRKRMMSKDSSYGTIARAFGLLSVFLSLPITRPAGFVAAEPSRASRSN